MLENLAISSDFSKLNPYSKVDTANGMPINNHRVVDPVSDSLRSKEFISKEKKRLRQEAIKLSLSLSERKESLESQMNQQSELQDQLEGVSKQKEEAKEETERG